MALYDSLTFMTQSQNIVWLGGTVVDKSGLAASFLILAINQGYSSRYGSLPNCSPSSTDPARIIPKPNWPAT